MTRLVDDEAYMVLLKQLALIDRMVDIVESQGSKYIHEAIDAARSTVNRWPAVAPVKLENGGKRELIEADFIGECGDHGLFWADHEVKSSDCPACASAEENADEIAEQVRADMLCDMARDERDERNSHVHPVMRGIVNAIAPKIGAAIVNAIAPKIGAANG